MLRDLCTKRVKAELAEEGDVEVCEGEGAQPVQLVLLLILAQERGLIPRADVWDCDKDCLGRCSSFCVNVIDTPSGQLAFVPSCCVLWAHSKSLLPLEGHVIAKKTVSLLVCTLILAAASAIRCIEILDKALQCLFLPIMLIGFRF